MTAPIKPREPYRPPVPDFAAMARGESPPAPPERKATRQKPTPKPARAGRSGRAWSPDDDAALRAALESGKKWEEVAKALGRSLSACQTRASLIGTAPASKPAGEVISAERKARIFEMHAAGRLSREIAEEVGLSRSTISWHMRRAGVRPIRERKWTERVRRNVFARIAAGDRISEIARDYGTSETSMRRRVNEWRRAANGSAAP